MTVPQPIRGIRAFLAGLFPPSEKETLFIAGIRRISSEPVNLPCIDANLLDANLLMAGTMSTMPSQSVMFDISLRTEEEIIHAGPYFAFSPAPRGYFSVACLETLEAKLRDGNLEVEVNKGEAVLARPDFPEIAYN